MNAGITQSAIWVRRRIAAVKRTWRRKRLEIDWNRRCTDRLLARVRKMPQGCWVWTGSKSSRGYGWFKDNRVVPSKNVNVHRIAWELWRGPIPRGYLICHKCDNPPCINPDHLFAGTAADNTRDSWQKGRSNGEHLRSEEVRRKALRTVRQMYREGLLITVHSPDGRLRGRRRAGLQ